MGNIVVENLTNAEFNEILRNGGAGNVPAFDIITRRVFNLWIPGVRTDHYDVTPTTAGDARIMEEILNSKKQVLLNVWRARPTILFIAGRFVAKGLCYFMHHIRMGNANPGARYPSRNEAGPPWTITSDPEEAGGHGCCYGKNSTGGAGNGTNALARAEANRLADNGTGGQQARAACFEAEILGNAPDILAILRNTFLATTDPGTAPSIPAAPSEISPTVGTIPFVIPQEVPSLTFTRIAARFGLTVRELELANPQIENIDKIWVGQTIHIPQRGAAPPAFQERNVRVNVNSNLRVRASATTDSAVVHVLANNTPLTIIAEADGHIEGRGMGRWGKVRKQSGRVIGWVALDFVA